MAGLPYIYYPDGIWRAVGGRQEEQAAIPDVFTLGFTRPVPDANTGVPLSMDLTPYTGPNAGGLLTITSPKSYYGVDFGTTQIDIRSSDVHFDYCKWTWKKAHDLTYTGYSATDTTHANASVGSVVHMRNGSSFTNRTFNFCTFENQSQWAPITVPMIGYNYTVTRSVSRGFGDCAQCIVPTSRPDTASGVSYLGCWFGELSWWDAPTGGIVHPTTRYQHCDCIQWQGGTGMRIEGCDLQAVYSLKVGTGTPNSGNNTAGLRANLSPYDQATSEARRYEIVEGSGTYSAGKWGAFQGGSLSGAMFSTSPAGYVANAVFRNNWGTAGSSWLNAGDKKLTGPFGEVSGNRVDNNQRLAGWAMNISAAVTLDYHDNVWTDGSGLIVPKRF